MLEKTFLKSIKFANRSVILPIIGKASFDEQGKALIPDMETGQSVLKNLTGTGLSFEIVSVGMDGIEVDVELEELEGGVTEVDTTPSVEDVIKTLGDKATSLTQLKDFATSYFKDKNVEKSDWDKLKKAELSEFLIGKVEEFSK